MNLSPAASLLAVLAVICVIVLIRGLAKALAVFEPAQQKRLFRKALIITIAWMLVTGGLAAAGFFSSFSQWPPRPVLAILVPLPFVLYICFAPRYRSLLAQLPLEWPVLFQVFRVGVELVLFFAYTRGELPVQMTFGGWNFDILAGLLALPVGYYCALKKQWPGWLLVLYNVAGLLLLLNVLIVALLSFPLPIRYFMNEPSTAVVGTFPFIYLPAVLVVLAYSLHIISLRSYWLQRFNK